MRNRIDRLEWGLHTESRIGQKYRCDIADRRGYRGTTDEAPIALAN